ncbi:MAG: hypothetical protein M3077_06065 [Candidatus Dormibacteraeota bacterium]|nr:hypothetical protein [Candidatus Dormibacteraeota bacterium]
MSALSVVSILVVLIALLVVGAVLVYGLCMSRRFFGNDPGGRDPNLPGQFLVWGNGPNYIDFLRRKRKLSPQEKRRHNG